MLRRVGSASRRHIQRRALPVNLKIRDSGFDIRDRGLAPERGLELSLGSVPIPDPTADPGGDRAGSSLAPADGEHSLHAALILKLLIHSAV